METHLPLGGPRALPPTLCQEGLGSRVPLCRWAYCPLPPPGRTEVPSPARVGLREVPYFRKNGPVSRTSNLRGRDPSLPHAFGRWGEQLSCHRP